MTAEAALLREAEELRLAAEELRATDPEVADLLLADRAVVLGRVDGMEAAA